jgi:phospholipase D1/2
MPRPAQLTIWDVFLLDAEFQIERPKRYYRQPLNLLQSVSLDHGGHSRMHAQGDQISTMGSIRQRLSKIFHVCVCHSDNEQPNGGVELDEFSTSPRQDDPVHSSSTSASSLPPSRAPTPILDPSTNANPLSGGDEHPDEMAGKPMNIHGDDQKQKKPGADVSMHTFYIKNSQMRLKLFAHSRVCIVLDVATSYFK